MLEGATVHTTLPAIDMDRAKAFYRDQVGATAGDEKEGGAFFALGETRFTLYPTPNPTRGGHTQMGILVKDVGAAVEELKGRGVTFEEYDFPGLKTVDGIASIGGGRAAWFKDTEGNTIGVVEFN
ncbi:MAG TPA: VOC family protein [Candidatus Dormibacteraeota bacterium]|jgi:predicted enzyme related to lactoylglutathione lyase|nr:VOC family protein [Candidatus Dormibacteraeota bacterium]